MAAREDVTQWPYIAVGPHCWGRGKDVGEALRYAKKNLPNFVHPRKDEACYRVYKVGPGSYVEDVNGAICYPLAGPKPEHVGDFGVSLKPFVKQ
jgi:hypothetical protein